MSIQQSMNQLLNTASAMGAIYAHTPEHQGRLATKQTKKRTEKVFRETEKAREKARENYEQRSQEILEGDFEIGDYEDFINIVGGLKYFDIGDREKLLDTAENNIRLYEDLYKKVPTPENLRSLKAARQYLESVRKQNNRIQELENDFQTIANATSIEEIPETYRPLFEKYFEEYDEEFENLGLGERMSIASDLEAKRIEYAGAQFPTQPQRTNIGRELPFPEPEMTEEPTGEEIDEETRKKRFLAEQERVNQERIEETQRMRQNQDLQNMTEEVSGEELPLPLQLNETFEDLQETVKPTAEVDDNTGGEIQMPQTQPKPRPKPQLKPRQLAEQQSFEGLLDAIDSTRQSREGLEARKQFLLDARNSTIGGNQ